MSSTNRQSFLSYDPVQMSLTEGTSIPPPVHTPPQTANGSSTQPTRTTKGATAASTHSDVYEPPTQGQGRSHSVRSPGAPSVTSKSPKNPGVRRLFSLSSLRSSFNSSRTSLASPSESTNNYGEDLAGVKRPSSPTDSSVTAASSTQRPQARPTTRQTGSWFRRKSRMMPSGGDQALASIGEDGRPVSKKAREHSPAPLLPEVQTLAGGKLNDGAVDWDEQLFNRRA